MLGRNAGIECLVEGHLLHGVIRLDTCVPVFESFISVALFERPDDAASRCDRVTQEEKTCASQRPRESVIVDEGAVAGATGGRSRT